MRGCSHEVAELAAAFAPSAERRLETLAQGAAFLTAVKAVWPHAGARVLGLQNAEIAYPVAVGVCAAAHGLPLAATAQAFVQAFAANLVSAGVRLIPLGQTDGLRVIARLEPLIPRVVAGALAASLDDVGGIAVMADIASMRHETQYTRLFRHDHAARCCLWIVLAAIAVLHAAWGLGSHWPCESERPVRTAGGTPARPMYPPLLLPVARCCRRLGVAAVRRRLLPEAWPRWLTCWPAPASRGISGRGVAGYTPAWRRLQSAEPFATLDRRYYAPLCLALGTGFSSSCREAAMTAPPTVPCASASAARSAPARRR